LVERFLIGRRLHVGHFLAGIGRALPSGVTVVS
jgi:hypothetical protein